MLARSNLSSQLCRPRASRDDARGDRASALAPASVRLAELLGRLSLAFDIANGAQHGTGVRSVVLAVELGRRAGASDRSLRDTFWTALLTYLGCADDSVTSDTARELAQIVGFEGGFIGDALALPTCLAQVGRAGERARQQHGRAGAVALMRARGGETFDPRLAQVFAAEQVGLFDAIEDAGIFDRFLALEPTPVACADEHRVDDVARTLAILADLRCPMFFGHSTAVAALAERAAGQIGLRADDTRALRRAALLHDIGRLGVPNAIWMRPGQLDWVEMEQVRLHAYYTERVLAPIGVLGPVADIAAAAHERLDGSGYAQSRVGRSLLPAARILAAADVAIAMSEARPYRPALSPAGIARELVDEAAAGHIDAMAADAVLASMGLKTRVATRNTHGVSERELDVCRLIARGKMNKEIAEILGISLRTVQNHVAHIFDKLGVHSRSGVAVWLVESNFVQ